MSNLAERIIDEKQMFWNMLTPKQQRKLEMLGHSKQAPQNISFDDARMLKLGVHITCALQSLKRVVGLRLVA